MTAVQRPYKCQSANKQTSTTAKWHRYIVYSIQRKDGGCETRSPPLWICICCSLRGSCSYGERQQADRAPPLSLITHFSHSIPQPSHTHTHTRWSWRKDASVCVCACISYHQCLQLCLDFNRMVMSTNEMQSIWSVEEMIVFALFNFLHTF